MKFTLKDYQDEAVAQVLERLRKARRRWREENEKVAFSLTATTGAGKTVMAAAVFEALFFGNDDHDFEADSGAVVIWFSDDPSLNEQSRWRLNEASDKLTISSLVTVGNSFAGERFEPGKIYFLNTQKLSRNSLLVRGHDPDDPAVESADGQRIMPDLRSHTIWDTIRNTVEDPEVTLYLVLDEAHRGMKEGGRSGGDAKPTIVRQLINGSGGVPGIPIVWGISATVERFNTAIAGMQDRGTMANVVVDPGKVQESGLLKDTINLDVPDETGNFSTVLLRRATSKLRDISTAWAEYAEQQDDGDTVLPLMVLQVPNAPDPREIGTWLDTIFEEWPELPHDCVANVFGEHKTETFGKYAVPYIAPERVQESKGIRVLVAKDAISTGWDCPRAEVMVSFRRATDRTHITQLLGRMSANPMPVNLARPNTWLQPTTIREADGKTVDLPRFERHLLCDEDGWFPADLNSWERAALDLELKRNEVVAWYRNPSRASQDSLGIAYQDGDDIRVLRPDFIVFRRQADGTVAADIVDPHGTQFSDALPKLRGLVAYVEEHGHHFGRIDVLAKIGDGYKVLDLSANSVREKVMSAEVVTGLYESDAATEYVVSAK